MSYSLPSMCYIVKETDQIRFFSKKLDTESVKYLFVFERNGLSHMVLQFYEYGNLWDFVKAKTTTLSTACALLCQAGIAMEKMHKLGFSHGDIKPENILIDNKTNIVFADLMTAQHASQTSTTSTGTPNYWSANLKLLFSKLNDLSHEENIRLGNGKDEFSFATIVAQILKERFAFFKPTFDLIHYPLTEYLYSSAPQYTMQVLISLLLKLSLTHLNANEENILLKRTTKVILPDFKMSSFSHNNVPLHILFPCVQILVLDGNNISDIAPLQLFNQLKELSLQKNRIADITPLQFLVSLKILNVDRNKIRDITPLQYLKELEELSACGNKICNLSPLCNLLQLQVLSMSYNSIFDIEALRFLTKLQCINLCNNEISNVSPLQHLASLKYLYLAENDFIRDSLSEYFPILERTDIQSIKCSRGKPKLNVSDNDVDAMMFVLAQLKQPDSF